MLCIKSYFTGFYAHYAFGKEDNLNPRLATTFTSKTIQTLPEMLKFTDKTRIQCIMV